MFQNIPHEQVWFYFQSLSHIRSQWDRRTTEKMKVGPSYYFNVDRSKEPREEAPFSPPWTKANLIISGTSGRPLFFFLLLELRRSLAASAAARSLSNKVVCTSLLLSPSRTFFTFHRLRMTWKEVWLNCYFWAFWLGRPRTAAVAVIVATNA